MKTPGESLVLPDNTILVSELGGTPRSGKGSIAEDLEATYDGVQVEETGIHYRAFTGLFYNLGIIDPDMEVDEITETVNKVDEGAFAEMGGSKKQIVGQFSQPFLYGDEISKMVPGVGNVGAVRSVVKGALRQRVTEATEEGLVNALVLDGRNLAPVIQDIPGLTLVLRTFVWCMPLEAAYRQAAMLGVEPGTEEFAQIYDDINTRFHKDQNRDKDPARADDNAIDYWHDKGVNEFTAAEQGRLVRDADYARRLGTAEGHAFASNVRFGAGTLAVRSGRQIKFDTTPFRGMSSDPKNHMLQAAHVMFKEAVNEFARTA